MSLIICKECGSEISKTADNCPNCGARKKWYIRTRRFLSVLVTLLTLAMTVISIFIARKSLNVSKKSLDVSEKSLDISKQATDISDIALKTSSLNTEPIFDISIDRNKDKLLISHETYEMYKIKYVTFAKVRTMAVMNRESEDISNLEIGEKYGEMPLTKGRSTNVGGCSEEEAEKYNKSLEVSLDIDWMNEEIPKIDKLEKKVKKECKNRKDIHYWGVSPDFNYYYFEIVYSDVHGNLNSAYYVYKKEYMTDWKTYKITREEYQRYTENILYEYNGTKREDKRIIKELFSDKNFKKFENSKYDQYWEWFNLRQFE